MGCIISDKLVSSGLATSDQYVNLTLPTLWSALRSDDWGKNFDPYNQILVPLQKHGPCGAGLGITVLACPSGMVWKDHTNNQQLPMLLTAILQQCSALSLSYEEEEKEFKTLIALRIASLFFLRLKEDGSPLTRFELLLLLVGERERSRVRTLPPAPPPVPPSAPPLAVCMGPPPAPPPVPSAPRAGIMALAKNIAAHAGWMFTPLSMATFAASAAIASSCSLFASLARLNACPL